MIRGFLICMALAVGVGAFLAIAACIVGGRNRRESLPGDLAVPPAEPDAPWALFDAPEFREALTDYLAAEDARLNALRTPGMGSLCADEWEAFEADFSTRVVYDVDERGETW